MPALRRTSGRRDWDGLALLKANEIEPNGATSLLSLEGEAARSALLHRQVEAIIGTAS